MYTVEDDKGSGAEKLTRMAKRLENAKANAWKRWKREYVHSLMESHRLNKETGTIPQVGEIVLTIGDEKNRGEWRKGKVVRLIKGKEIQQLKPGNASAVTDLREGTVNKSRP